MRREPSGTKLGVREGGGMQPMLRLDVEPEWSEVDRVRESSAAFLRTHGLDAEAVEALSMVACELTENAVKYGTFEGRTREIGVTVTLASQAVTVEVRSPVADDADDGAMATLDYMIQWIRGHQDPFEAYIERLKEVSAQNMTSLESGLGLFRIAYEGHCILDFYVDDQSILAVSAVYPLDPDPGAVA
jgi:hypothetical protein